MPNEFVARRGLISSGSINVSGSVTASFFRGDGSQLTNISNAALPGGVVSSSTQLPAGTVSSSAQYSGWVTASSQIDYNNITNKLSGVISSSTQFNALASTSASFAATASFVNTLLQTVSASGNIVAGANLISNNSIGDEGGEILLAKPQTNTGIAGTGVTIDIFQNKLRFFEQGGSARGFFVDVTSGSGAAGTNLQAGTSAVSSYTNATDNRVITSTGAGGINAESTLTYDGTVLAISTNNAKFLQGGDDSALHDINVANTLGVYGVQDSTVGAIKLGSNGQVIYSNATGVGIGTITPGALLHVQGTASASSFIGPHTGSILSPGVVSASSQYPGWVTASSQIDYNSIQNKLSGVVSSSAQVAPLLPAGTVSSSAQYPGWVTASSQIDYNSITNKLSGVYSSSAQTVAALSLQTIAPATVNATNVLSGSVLQTGTNALIGGKLAVTGSAEFTGTVTASILTPNQAVFTNASDGLVSNAITGTGNVVMSASPTLTGTITAASINASANISASTLAVNGNVTVGASKAVISSTTGTLTITHAAGAAVNLVGGNSYQLYADGSNNFGLFSNTAGVNRLVVDSSGNVGIGDATPSDRLVINGRTRINGTNVLAFGSALGGYADIGITGVTTGTMVFRTWNGSIFAERLRIVHDTGNVGIGTSSPSASLHVSASGATNDLLIGGVTTPKLFVSASGNVGVGTTSPDANFTVQGQSSFNSGSLANPGIAARGDLNTGIYFPAADTIGFVEGGVEAMRLDASGRLGIGTTIPSRTLTVNGSTNITGSLDVTGAFTAQTKSFKIQHQVQTDKSLVYGVLEGPEHAVYVRGKLTNANIIQLPDEWEWLVDEDTITVQLTPIGSHQKLYVESTNSKYITIAIDGFFTKNINCYYLVHATRKDVAPLQTVQ
jgi:hypothetical protein